MDAYALWGIETKNKTQCPPLVSTGSSEQEMLIQNQEIEDVQNIVVDSQEVLTVQSSARNNTPTFQI